MKYDQFIEAVKQQMQPEGRAKHLAGSLQELLAIVPDDVTLADVAAGWQVLAHPQSENEKVSMVHRRQVQAELVKIATQFTSKPGSLAGAIKTWQVWQKALQDSAAPHQVTMAKTLAQELLELQAAL